MWGAREADDLADRGFKGVEELEGLLSPLVGDGLPGVRVQWRGVYSPLTFS